MMKRSLAFLPLFAGCYSYSAVSPATVPVGAEVRARITGAASDRVAPLVGSLDTRDLVGNVVENTNGSLVLQVPLGAMPNVTRAVVPLQTTVPLAPGDFVNLERRSLDRGRTITLAAVIAGGLAAAAYAASKAGGNAEPGNGPPDPPPINRIPIRIWRISF